MEEFFSCNKREVDEVADRAKRGNEDAISEYNEAVESFNRRANQ